MVSRIVLVWIAVAAVALVSGCGSDEPRSGGRSVVAAFYPLAYAAEEVGGESVSVRNLTPPGAEPHDLELTAGDVADVRDADLVLYLGNGFQPALADAVEGRSGPSLDLFTDQTLMEGAAHHHGAEPEPEDEEPELDPHIWLDPMRYATMARAIARELGTPAAADDLVERLHVLDAELTEGLATCERREIVTSHAAFGYLAERYDLEQIPLTGLTPEAEPSAKQLEELVHEVEEEGATTVFFETLVAPELAETVAREASARTAVLDPLEGLTDERRADGADYFTVMHENLVALRQALGCK